MPPVGRPAVPVEYHEVQYQDGEYVVGKVVHKHEHVYFVIDKIDYPRIRDLSWHYTANAYIGHTHRIDNSNKVLYMHNLIMNHLDHPGKGATESIDHINRNGLDNRRANLRMLTQSEQNINQTKKKRVIQLPADCGIHADDIPKHIWYVRANGSHGDRFAIELKTENLVWKSTSSIKVPLHQKLEQAKEKLREIYMKYPYLDPNEKSKVDQYQALASSYTAIVELAMN